MNFLNRFLLTFQCNRQWNRKIFCLKRSWNEVASLLNLACEKKCRPNHHEHNPRHHR